MPEPAARRSLRARLGAGPLGRRVAALDVRIYRFLRQDLQVPAAERAVRVYTTAGEHAALWHAIALTGAAVDARRRGDWLRASRTILATQLLNTALKGVVRRSRPELEDLPALVAVPTSLSFPSAHASSSFAGARTLSPLLGRRARRPLYAGAAAMALSRVYLGVHYPTDITVGAALGLAMGTLTR